MGRETANYPQKPKGRVSVLRVFDVMCYQPKGNHVEPKVELQAVQEQRLGQIALSQGLWVCPVPLRKRCAEEPSLGRRNLHRSEPRKDETLLQIFAASSLQHRALAESFSRRLAASCTRKMPSPVMQSPQKAGPPRAGTRGGLESRLPASRSRCCPDKPRGGSSPRRPWSFKRCFTPCACPATGTARRFRRARANLHSPNVAKAGMQTYHPSKKLCPALFGQNRNFCGHNLGQSSCFCHRGARRLFAMRHQLGTMPFAKDGAPVPYSPCRRGF